MGLVKDIYCGSKFHIFSSLRNKWCKEWDEQHKQPAEEAKAEAKTEGDKPVDAASTPAPAPAPRPPRRAQALSRDDTDTSDDTPDATMRNRAARPTPTSGPSPTPLPDTRFPVAATSLPSGTPFPPTLSPSATSAPVANSPGMPTGAIVGLVLGGCVAALIVAGFLVHRRRSTARAQAQRSIETGEVFRPDYAAQRVMAPVTPQDFSAAPPGLLDLTRDVHPELVKPVRGLSSSTTQSKKEVNRGSWPVRPKGDSNGWRPSHTRTPTRDVIFAQPTDADAVPLHVDDLHVNGSISEGSDVFGTPIFDDGDLTASINAATAAVLSSGQTSPRSVVVRTSAPLNETAAAAILEDRHSMEWPDFAGDDPLELARVEEELRVLRGASFVAEEFPEVPKQQ